MELDDRKEKAHIIAYNNNMLYKIYVGLYNLKLQVNVYAGNRYNYIKQEKGTLMNMAWFTLIYSFKS